MKKLSIPGAICLAFAALFLFLGIGIFVQQSNAGPMLEKELIMLDAPVVLPENEGKLVAIQGEVIVGDDRPEDDEFGIISYTPILYRRVSMYQWQEDRQTFGNNTEYEYSKTWSEKVINSLVFNDPVMHGNPLIKPYETKSFHAQNLTLGDFQIDAVLFAYVPADRAIPMESLGFEHPGMTTVGNCFQTDHAGAGPSIGDVRVAFNSIEHDLLLDVTVMGKQSGNAIVPYVSNKLPDDQKLWTKSMTKDDIIRDAQATGQVWGLFTCGVALVFGAVGAVLVLRKRRA